MHLHAPFGWAAWAIITGCRSVRYANPTPRQFWFNERVDRDDHVRAVVEDRSSGVTEARFALSLCGDTDAHRTFTTISRSRDRQLQLTSKNSRAQGAPRRPAPSSKAEKVRTASGSGCRLLVFRRLLTAAVGRGRYSSQTNLMLDVRRCGCLRSGSQEGDACQESLHPNCPGADLLSHAWRSAPPSRWHRCRPAAAARPMA